MAVTLYGEVKMFDLLCYYIGAKLPIRVGTPPGIANAMLRLNMNLIRILGVRQYCGGRFVTTNGPPPGSIWRIGIARVFMLVWELMVQEAAPETQAGTYFDDKHVVVEEANAVDAPEVLAKAHAANMEYDALFKFFL